MASKQKTPRTPGAAPKAERPKPTPPRKSRSAGSRKTDSRVAAENRPKSGGPVNA